MAEHRLNACRYQPASSACRVVRASGDGVQAAGCGGCIQTDVVAAPRGPPVAVARRRPQRGIDCGRSAALSDDLIEELRLLANIESDDAKLLPLILAGQPELALRLNEHQLRQFKQRITLRCQLVPFTLQETAAYVFGRVRLAGGDATRLFTRNAVVAIHGASKGIPRAIGVLCDNSLLTGFALQRRPVDEAIVEEVCRDFDLLAAAEAANVNTAAGHPETARDEGPRPGEGKTPAATSAPTEPVRFGPIPIGHRRVR